MQCQSFAALRKLTLFPLLPSGKDALVRSREHLLQPFDLLFQLRHLGRLQYRFRLN